MNFLGITFLIFASAVALYTLAYLLNYAITGKGGMECDWRLWRL